MGSGHHRSHPRGGDQLEVYRAALGERLGLVVLDPGAVVCVARDRQRAPLEQFAFDGHDALRATMVEGLGERGWWLDSSHLSAQETAALVLLEADERASYANRLRADLGLPTDF